MGELQFDLFASGCNRNTAFAPASAWPCPSTDPDGKPIDHPGTPRLFEPGSWNPVARGARAPPRPAVAPAPAVAEKVDTSGSPDGKAAVAKPAATADAKSSQAKATPASVKTAPGQT